LANIASSENNGTSESYQQIIKDYNKAIELNLKYAYFMRAVAYKALGNNTMFIQNIKVAAQLEYKPAQKYLTSKGIEWQ